MTIRLEHANLDVRDLEETLRFLTTAFPEFRIRGEGLSLGGGAGCTSATTTAYLALAEATQAPAEPWVPYVGRPGLNHLGFEVDDAEAVRERLRRRRLPGLDGSERPSAPEARLLPRPRGQRLGVRRSTCRDDPAKRHDYSLG